jgi:hypothetical protein
MRRFLLTHSSLSPLMMATGFEQALGGGAAAPGGQAPDNSGGNAGGESTQNGGGDNSGQDAELAAFWNGPAAAGAAGGSDSQSVPPNQQQQGAQPPANQTQQPKNFGDQLASEIQGLTFDNVINDEVATQLQAGNYEEFNKRLAAQNQTVVKQTVGLAIKIMGEFAKVMRAQSQQDLHGTLTTRDDTNFLESNFPAAKDPIAKPMVQAVWDQALKNTGGDRTKAITLAKRVLARGMGAAAGDLDYSFAPRNPGDEPPQTPINWLENLNMR